MNTTLDKVLASVAGIGLIGKGSGTIAAAAGVFIWHYFKLASVPLLFTGVGLIVLCGIGVLVGNRVEEEWGVDSSRVVIDELAGVGIALWSLPADWSYLVLAFLLFRVFDIAKPLGVKRMEKLPKGWGVMADDILAGIYANLILQVAVVSRAMFM